MSLNLNQDAVVLLDSSKSFWKTRTQLNVIIISYKLLSCLEVITFDPASGIDYKRVYIDSKKISTKLNQETIRVSFAEKQESCDRLKRTMKNKDEVLADIENSLIVKYIFDRVNQVVGSSNKVSRVWLQPTFDDIVVMGKEFNQIDVECEKPLLLVPYVHEMRIINS